MLPTPDLPVGRRELRVALVPAQKLGRSLADRFRETRCWGTRRPPPWHTYTRGALGSRVLATHPAHRLLVVQQRIRPGHAMPWSASDVLHVIEALPAGMRRPLQFLILRQPTRREKPVDGLAFTAFDLHGECGGAIILNAVSTGILREFDANPGADALDLGVMRRLGADLVRRRFTIEVRYDPETARAFMLYHVLLHEIGHLNDDDYDHDREAWAEQFALAWERRLRALGVIPFRSIPDLSPPVLRRHGWPERIRRRAIDT